MVKFNYYIKFYNDVEENYDKLNVSLKVSNILKKKLEMYTLLEMDTFDLFKE
jgi:hypothetical protein